MAEALGKALGVKVEFVQTAWPQLMKDFEADNFDIAMGGVSITLDRQKKGLFSTPIMREGKTPIARCADKGKYETIADIDKPGTRVIVNPGGTNERFARANVKNAEIKVYNDNVTIFDEIAKGNADLMMTDSSETLYQQKLHPGVLCAVHPDKPFDFAEKAYWLQRDVALKAFVDQWLHIAIAGRQLQEDLRRLVRLICGKSRRFRLKLTACRVQITLAASEFEPKPLVHDLLFESDLDHVS